MTKKKSRSETAFEALGRLQAWLKEEGKDSKVVFQKRSSAAAVAEAEKALGFKLPPSYVGFLTTHGAFMLRNGGVDSMSMSRAEDLLGMGPYDDDVDIGECVSFQEESDSAVENYYVFDPKDWRADGELAVRVYFHDDGLQDRRGRGSSFDEHVSALVDEIIDDELVD